MIETPRRVDVRSSPTSVSRAGARAPTTWVRSWRRSPGRQPVPALAVAVLAAREAGIAILDGVYNATDEEGFLAECRQGFELGCDGKTLIHPNQVDGANAPVAVADDIARRAVIAAFTERCRKPRGGGRRGWSRTCTSRTLVHAAVAAAIATPPADPTGLRARRRPAAPVVAQWRAVTSSSAAVSSIAAGDGQPTRKTVGRCGRSSPTRSGDDCRGESPRARL